MPELPEVEGYARYFARHALRQRIIRVRVPDPRILSVPKAKLVKPLAGREFTEVRRHGKHLFARAGDTWLHLHFGMSGGLAYYRGNETPRFARVIFDFANDAHLAFEDMRLFGVVGLVDDPDAFIAARDLGPDPMALDLRGFRRRLAGKRGGIKALLLSQNVIAGVGNLYADETLFRSGIHPRRAADDLGDAEVKSLFANLRKVLREAIGGRRLFLIEQRNEGDPCPRCGGAIRRTVAAGRTTYFCPSHQR